MSTDNPVSTHAQQPAPAQRIFCNRTLNLRRIKAIGYDMDYTLIHYRVQVWEQKAYTYLQERLAAQGWPVEELSFDPELVMRGLIIDSALGNVVKANRFGYVKRAFHGSRLLDYPDQRSLYERTLIDLKEPRWHFLNTLFSLSEACMYMQLVDLLDAGKLPVSFGYPDLFQVVRRSIDETHMEGRLKADILADLDHFVEVDPDMPLALLDQKESGKSLLLITNSEWSYAAPMLSYVFDRFLPGDLTWKDLFDLAIVGARKPDFFTLQSPAFEVVTTDGLLREHYGPLEMGHVYVGGNARLVEESLNLRGEEILYVGDHIVVDVSVSKNILRWRTALVIRELEDDVEAVSAFRRSEQKLARLMREKEKMEAEYAEVRLQIQRKRRGRLHSLSFPMEVLENRLSALREQTAALDECIAPLAEAAGRLHNPNWGLLMRTGNDKSHLARLVETFADIYTARVSTFLHHTPFAYLRSHPGSLPHDLMPFVMDDPTAP